MTWTPKQTGQFLDFALADRNYALWLLIAFRGPRRGEALDLDLDELNLPQTKITVRTSRHDNDPHSDVASRGQATTKNRKSRALGLDTSNVHILDHHRQTQLRQQKHLGNLYEDSGKVFTDELGRPLVSKFVSQQFDRLITSYETIRRAAEHRPGRGVATTPEALASQHQIPNTVSSAARHCVGAPSHPCRL